MKLRDGVQNGEYISFTIDANDNILRMQGRLCVADIDGLRYALMVDLHSFKYFMHRGSTKIYKDLKQHYQWRNMKMDIF